MPLIDYEPQRWEDVVGQGHVRAVLESPMGPLPPLLLSGPPNTGKTAVRHLVTQNRASWNYVLETAPDEGEVGMILQAIGGPPTLVMIETRDLELVPQALRAKTLHLRFEPLSADAIAQRLAQTHGGSPAVLSHIARRSKDIAEALEMADAMELAGGMNEGTYVKLYGRPDFAPALVALLGRGELTQAIGLVETWEGYTHAEGLVDEVIEHLTAQARIAPAQAYRKLAMAISACLDIRPMVSGLPAHIGITATVAKLLPAFEGYRPPPERSAPDRLLSSDEVEGRGIVQASLARIQQQQDHEQRVSEVAEALGILAPAQKEA